MHSTRNSPVLPENAPAIRAVPAGQVLRWLALGWRDLRASGWPSLMHGVLVTAVSLIIVAIAVVYWPLLPGAVSGFVLVGPILATGLYALSRRTEQGKPAGFGSAVAAWRGASTYLLGYGLILVLAGTAWVLTSTLLFALFVTADIAGPVDFLEYVLEQSDWHFTLWLVLGGLGAALMFAISVVSVPLLVDRNIALRSALLTSIRAVGENPIATTLWALIIAVVTGLSIATCMLGFLISYPLLGHASWHAYRDLVDTSDLMPRSTLE